MLRLEMLEDRIALSIWTVTSPADDGDGSLRAVIADAQNGDQIVFDKSLEGQTITLTSGDLAISKDLDIEGPGADQLAVSGNHASRIFDISGGVNVTIAGLTITEGVVVGAPAEGGGILNNGSQLTVASDILSDNAAEGGLFQIGRGGAIANVSGASLTVTDSLFTRNATFGVYLAGGGGGGIFNAGSLSVTNSVFTGNYGEEGGGGVSNAGTLTITNSTFSHNSTPGGMGGGIWNSGVLMVSYTTFFANGDPNSPTEEGGGIANSGAATITYCTFASNSTGGIDFGGVGGAIQNSGTMSIEYSTIAQNHAIGFLFAGGYGGGISTGGTLSISNSTIADNTVYGYGGGISTGGTLSISNSTIADNSTTLSGGGVYDEFFATGINARNTIVAGNMAPNSPDLYGNLGSLGHNLIGNIQGGSGFDDTDLLNVDPLLGSLQDNGGPTQTMALQCRSPAIDAGDNTDAPDWDQRGPGYPRITADDPVIDIGAFEVQQNGGGRPGRFSRPGIKAIRFDLVAVMGIQTAQPVRSVPTEVKSEVAVVDALFTDDSLVHPGVAVGQPGVRDDRGRFHAYKGNGQDLLPGDDLDLFGPLSL